MILTITSTYRKPISIKIYFDLANLKLFQNFSLFEIHTLTRYLTKIELKHFPKYTTLFDRDLKIKHYFYQFYFW